MKKIWQNFGNIICNTVYYL